MRKRPRRATARLSAALVLGGYVAVLPALLPACNRRAASTSSSGAPSDMATEVRVPRQSVPTTNPDGALEPQAALEALVRANLDAELALRPTMASWLGDHGYDDKLDDVRTDAQLREATRLRTLADQLRALPDDKLTRVGRLDRKLLQRRTDAALHELSEMRPLERSPLLYVDIAQAGVDSLVSGERIDDASMGTDALRSLNGRLWRIRGLFDEARRNLRGSAPELSVRRAIDNAQALRAFLGETLPHLVAAVPDARLAEDARAASVDAGRALDDFVNWLQRDFQPRAHGELAIGPQRFWDRMRLVEAMPGSVEVLLPRVEAALRDATRRVDEVTKVVVAGQSPGPRLDALHLVEDDHPRAEELAAKTQVVVDQLATWGRERARLPVPPLGLPHVVEMPPQCSGLVQLEANAPLEKHARPAVVYLEPVARATSEKTRTELSRALNRPTLTVTLAHELLGHFLVSLARRQAPTLMQRVSSSMLLDEGFAAYVEHLLFLDSDDPKVRLVAERNSQLRLLRLYASIRFHAQAAKLDDIAKLFSDDAGLDDSQARREAERVALDPMVGAEALGRLEIERLRVDWQAAQGADATLAAFHAALLSYGGAPIELIREELLGAQ